MRQVPDEATGMPHGYMSMHQVITLQYPTAPARQAGAPFLESHPRPWRAAPRTLVPGQRHQPIPFRRRRPALGPRRHPAPGPRPRATRSC
jgi:hypothetical protein